LERAYQNSSDIGWRIVVPGSGLQFLELGFKKSHAAQRCMARGFTDVSIRGDGQSAHVPLPHIGENCNIKECCMAPGTATVLFGKLHTALPGTLQGLQLLHAVSRPLPLWLEHQEVAEVLL